MFINTILSEYNVYIPLDEASAHHGGYERNPTRLRSTCVRLSQIPLSELLGGDQIPLSFASWYLVSSSEFASWYLREAPTCGILHDVVLGCPRTSKKILLGGDQIPLGFASWYLVSSSEFALWYLREAPTRGSPPRGISHDVVLSCASYDIEKILLGFASWYLVSSSEYFFHILRVTRFARGIYSIIC